jgi:DNA processing protein
VHDPLAPVPPSLPELSRSEKIYRIQLARISGIGPVTFQRLINDYGNAATALKLHDFKNRKIHSIDIVEAQLKETQKFGAHTLIWGDKHYPRYLYELPDAPPILYAKGDISLLQRQTFGIVGARNASASGVKLTNSFAQTLGASGYIIASGLARGIDTAAHKASLQTGTIACIAGGLDMPYPPENTNLFNKIMQSGVVITEMPLGTQPQARHFPRRNRLIAGLSIGVIIIEAAKKSGSLITAKLAADYGRDIFAVPGSPLDPRSYGTNQLIKDGAVLTRDIDDILELQNEFQPAPLPPAQPLPKPPAEKITKETPPITNEASITHEVSATIPIQPLQPSQTPTDIILNLLSPSPVHIDDIIRQSGLPAHEATAIITTLEIEEQIVKHSGGRISLSA